MKKHHLHYFLLLFFSMILHLSADVLCADDTLSCSKEIETVENNEPEGSFQDIDCNRAPTFCDFMSTLFSPRDCDCFPLGFYLGGSVNYEHFWGHHEDRINNLPLNDREKFEDDSASVTLHAGYITSFPCTDCVLWGVEPYISAYNYNHYSSTNPFEVDNVTTSLRRRIHGGVAFRIGYILPCNFLAYGLIGPDVARFEFNEFDHASESNNSTSENLWGIIYGVGVEKPLCWCNVVVGMQATVTQYGSHTFTVPGTAQSHVIRPRVFDLSFRLSVPLN